MTSMDSIQIRPYKPEDHQEVRRIFSHGIQENVQNAFLLTMKKRKIQFNLALIFLLGSIIWNISAGILMLILTICLQAGIIYSGYYGYVR